jgi:hypothetical protein
MLQPLEGQAESHVEIDLGRFVAALLKKSAAIVRALFRQRYNITAALTRMLSCYFARIKKPRREDRGL